jgi:dethiobiotin synthetase
MKYFITGIDTDAGKSVVTGLLAKFLLSIGKNVITAKLVETGNTTGISHDITTHRKIMGQELNYLDYNNDTCPQLFELPASPHLAASLENSYIDFELINNKLMHLEEQFEIVLVEGAGGLFVPLKGKYTTFDFIVENYSPVIVVSTNKLGSINHTLMTVNHLLSSMVQVAGIVYNKIYDENPLITQDTEEYFKNYYETIPVIPVDKIDLKNPPTIDFTPIFENTMNY